MSMRLSRRQIAQYAADRLQADDAAVLAQLAAHLVETKRTNEVDLIVRDIEDALEQRGIVIADVATARNLDAKLQHSIAQFIKAMTDASSVHIRASTDESLIGGVRVRTPQAEYDASVQRALTKLQAMKV